MSDTLYPASPALDKSQFTKMTSQYRSQIIINLAAIVLFFLLFMIMIAGAGYLIYIAWEYPLSRNFTKWEVLLKIGCVGMAVMLFLFLLKFLFKKHSSDNPANIEIFEKDHPELFAFIRRLSKEVGAPFPKKIFVNHEINASVFYNSTILSLFLPIKKNLLIGLGLVNSVNLSEFKAIMAHEFGHFAQSSMKLGSYVYMANRIIYDMVYERDRWDEMLERWQRMDFRVAIFGWLLAPVIWLVRLFLSLLYKALNVLHSALSRQMEYNADLVAVSVTGSDQIINGLYKMGLTSQSYDFTMGKLNDARDQKMITENLFYNHLESHQVLLDTKKEFAALDISQKQLAANSVLFEQDDDASTLAMYASHPSNFKRERNAKQNYVEGVTDDRSPWLLFGDAENLGHVVTKNLYELSTGQKNLSFTAKEEVQQFINEELSESEHAARYHNFYQQHNVTVPEQEELEAEKQNLSLAELKSAIGALWNHDFQNSMKSVNQNMDKLNEVIRFIQSPPKNGSIEVNGHHFKAKDAMQAYHAVNKMMEPDLAWFKSHDLKVYHLYTQLNAHLRPGDTELADRYAFLKATQDLSAGMEAARELVQEEAQAISELAQPEEADILSSAGKFVGAKLKFQDLLEEAAAVKIPPLKNVGDIASLDKFLLPEPVAHISSNEVNFERLQRLLYQMDDALGRLSRLYNKNLGMLLTLQEILEAEMESGSEKS